MAFQKLPGNLGKIYIPNLAETEKKHPCPDCFACQWCGDQRCHTCRAKGGRRVKKGPRR